jgi:hypothetical protein
MTPCRNTMESQHTATSTTSSDPEKESDMNPFTAKFTIFFWIIILLGLSYLTFDIILTLINKILGEFDSTKLVTLDKQDEAETARPERVET